MGLWQWPLAGAFGQGMGGAYRWKERAGVKGGQCRIDRGVARAPNEPRLFLPWGRGAQRRSGAGHQWRFARERGRRGGTECGRTPAADMIRLSSSRPDTWQDRERFQGFAALHKTLDNCRGSGAVSFFRKYLPIWKWSPRAIGRQLFPAKTTQAHERVPESHFTFR